MVTHEGDQGETDAVPPIDECVPESVPPIEECVSDADLDAATRVFQLYVDRPEFRAHAQSSQKLRTLFGLALRTVANKEDSAKSHRKRREVAKRREADRSKLATTGIRQARSRKLVGHAAGSFEKDQVAQPPRTLKSVAELEEYSTKDDEEQNINRTSTPTLSLPAPESAHESESSQQQPSATRTNKADHQCTNAPRKLNFPRACHVCTNSFSELHHFYDQLCPSCAEFNFAKRSFSADMRGRVCILTGARVKIGYCIALKLLRMGATLIATTRFPHDAATRFAKEADFETFQGRLFIFGIDFRDINMVHHFCRHIRGRFPRLDVLINNAAQTVRKPPKFYEHLLANEAAPLSTRISNVAHVVDVYRDGPSGYTFKTIGASSEQQQATTQEDAQCIAVGLPAQSSVRPLSDVNTSAALSQIPLLDEDVHTARDSVLFPAGQLDRDDQQVDLRGINSWTLEIGQISTVEMLECHVINAFAPWVLISELKPLMEATRQLPGQQDQGAESNVCDKYIVNVSAMEGQFYRPKTVYHPHTNMAKASLNMLTRTSAAGFAAISIFMTAVDTGWITDENPVEEWSKRENAPPPLDEWDAAMRVLDPVLMGVNDLDRVWGVFLKNYLATRW